MSNAEHEENHDEKKAVVIVVNGREKEVEKDKLSYEDIAVLAYGAYEDAENVVYTISYSKGEKPENGSIVKGETVKAKQGMIINVTRTIQS